MAVGFLSPSSVNDRDHIAQRRMAQKRNKRELSMEERGMREQRGRGGGGGGGCVLTVSC